MDFDLMISSFPKLLNATLITLKLLSASLIFGLFIGLIFMFLFLSYTYLLEKFSTLGGASLNVLDYFYF